MALGKKRDKAPKAPKPPGGGRLKQTVEAYSMTAKVDKLLPLWLLLGFVVTFAAFLVLALLVGHPIIGGILAVFFGVLGMLVVFGQRVQKAAYSEIEGQPGAAAAALNTMKRGGWTVTPAVAVNKSQDIVHRAVGRPGIILIGEGPANRVGPLLEAEKRRMNRFVADVPVTDIVVGRGEGEIPLPKLIKFLRKMPKRITGGVVVETNDRLRAVGDLMANVPIPKGPMPKSGRTPKGQNPKMR
ncbi:DUF4191 domain-containing protein [Sporichthya sp.]|uniref:DUF4191 domain-containing protein n=1 Tax=Sporichthya sp. TaxID=65475 RepID=UPI0017E947C5|nr:DUF4191 domain-containing protein [Sporichthya sp.]MBA3743792.1 DUF4191 domain-containing protein [Sporichthya sp.]